MNCLYRTYHKISVHFVLQSSRSLNLRAPAAIGRKPGISVKLRMVKFINIFLADVTITCLMVETVKSKI